MNHLLLFFPKDLFTFKYYQIWINLTKNVVNLKLFSSFTSKDSAILGHQKRPELFKRTYIKKIWQIKKEKIDVAQLHMLQFLYITKYFSNPEFY